MYLKVSQVLADYIYSKYDFDHQYVVLNYDHECDFEEIKEAAAVFAGNGVNVYLFEDPATEENTMEAIKKMDCAAGLIIKKNGFQFFDKAGEMPKEISSGFLKQAESMTYDDIITADFGVSFSFLRIMYIKP